MATRYRIIEAACIECAVCVEECPLAAISAEPYSIDPAICDGCGACAEACPAEAIEEYEWTPPNLGNGSGGKNGVTMSIGIGIK